MTGKLIVIDGLDGSGKATQSQLLAQRLTQSGTAARRITFPDYNDDSSKLVQMYLRGDFGDSPDAVNTYAASSFYAVDRYASYKRHWQEDYNNGTVIIADRYTTSNAVHQMAKLEEDKWDSYLEWLYDYEYNLLGLPAPDAVIFLDMPLEVSQNLMKERYGGDEGKKDIHERALEYLASCRRSAQYAAAKGDWHILQCAHDGKPDTIECISDSILALIKKAGLI
ncbi:MAG: deoxynucleoside kinase [Clostridia bacterium]|nr:deoxynucleoside kinase [Clostridia bacterium]